MEETKKANKVLGGLIDFLSSVKLSVAILLLLAGTSIIGTFLPQNQSPEEYLQNLGEMRYRLFDTLDLFDMYHSWWYQFLLLFLSVNLIVCSLKRISQTSKIVFIKKPVFNLAKFRKSPNKKEFTATLPMETLVENFLRTIESRFAKCIVEKNETGYAIFSEKGRWTRFGVYGVHLSILFMIAGGLAGSRYGFEGYMTIPEKSSRQVIQKKNSDEKITLDFEIRCDRFEVSFYDTGAPKEYRSRLTILENGQEQLTQDILVNQPLRYKEVRIFQSSYGSLPPETIPLVFGSKETGMEFVKNVTIGEEIDIPGGFGKFTLQEYSPSYLIQGHDLRETFLGLITSGEGKQEPVVLPVRFPKFDKMRKGEIFISVGDYEERYYTGLQVTKDPGVVLVYTGFILIIIGCYITFFMSHQKVCIEIRKEKEACQVMIAGTANKNKLGINRIVEGITQQLSEKSR